GEGAPLELAQAARGGVGLLPGLGRAEDAERIAVAAPRAGPGRERGGLARELRGLELPGGAVGIGPVGLGLGHFVLVHAGEEVPVLVVLGRVRLAEPVEL